ncbi:MAG: TetR/AcrR family transcriptional regulator [Desulfobacteraceae bacterium]|nr:TetR/AcrR family transcriptional regulator [Desulfobacteraceae bacterium]
MGRMSSFERLRENEREIRKELIITAAMELFEKKNFWDISMRDIANTAGVSASSLYRYFPSRDDLFIEALLQDISHIEKLLKERMVKGEEGIEALAIAVVDYCLDNEPTFQMMCHFLMRGDENPSVNEKFNSVQLRFLEMFEKVVKSIAGEDAVTEFHIQAFFASLSGIVMTFRHFPGYTDDERRAYIHKLALLIMREGGTIGKS